ncbi:MAG: Hsp70 family protein, partial [Acidobacteriota bacterium]
MERDVMETLFNLEDVSFRYILGIDLGTTNSALAYVDRSVKGKEGRSIKFLNIPQLVSVGEMGRRSVLPSFLYVPGPFELPPESTALPWESDREYAVGEFAREQGALVPGRMVSSAKSWLCHGGVDRGGAILPWGAGPEVNKVSPVRASGLYLQHLRESWNDVIARKREGFGFEDQLIILTVPASFDEVARELTIAAAKDAGLPRAILVEEPLAAFYSWLSRNEATWQTQMKPGQLILVCDVGGGTTDFTIVAVREGEKGLRFDRLAVGEHLMLGGDNMDLALARHLEMELLGQPGKLDPKRWHQLWHQCRKAKEILLGDAEGNPPRRDSFDITLMGSGRKLIADTLKATLTKEKVQELILDGFFPFIPLDDQPKATRRSGLTEWGLPFVQDPAVTRHMAAFWQRFRTLLHQETGREAIYPDFVLFNGGALIPRTVRTRILDVIQQWFQPEAEAGWAPVELDNPYPELAVAIGAAYYGLVRLGEGVRVGAGSPRSYYVEVAGSGESEERRAVCLIPRGTEEGFESQVDQLSFEVLANQPVAFQLFSSSTRLGDRFGDVVTLSEEEITILPPIRTVLRYGKRGEAQALPVKLGVRLTEVGTLELWCRSQQSPHRWQLQFDVRQDATIQGSDAGAGETLDADVIEAAQAKIVSTFTRGGDTSPEKR